MTPIFSPLESLSTRPTPWRAGLRRSVLCAVLVGAALGLSACGHEPRGFAMGAQAPMSEADQAQMHQRMQERISSYLALDATQKQNLSALANTLHEQHKLMHPADPRSDLKALIAGPRFDAQAAQTLAERRAEAMKSASPKVIAAFATFYDGLRPDQQQKVRDYMNRAPEGHGWRGGWHGGLEGSMGTMNGMGGMGAMMGGAGR